MVIIISTVVLPLILNKFGAGQTKPIKTIADRLRRNAKEKKESSGQRNERLETIVVRTNTTYRDLKSLSNRYKRTQDDIENVKTVVLIIKSDIDKIKSDIDKILEFIED